MMANKLDEQYAQSQSRDEIARNYGHQNYYLR